MKFLLLFGMEKCFRINNKIGLFKYLVIIFLLQVASFNAISQVNIDSLKQLVPSLKGGQKLKTIQVLTFHLQYENLEEYYNYARLGLEQALADDDSSYVAAFLVDIGYYHKFRGQYQKALNELSRARIIGEAKGYTKTLSNIYTALGAVYHDLGFYDKALEYNSKSLNLKEQLGLVSELGTSYNNIGLIFYKIDDHEKAIEYYKKSLEIKLQGGDTSRCILTYINIGLAYSESEERDKWRMAIENFKTANKLAIKFDQRYRLGYSYNGLANVFIQNGTYDSAKYFLNLSTEESIKNDYKMLESSNYYLLAKIAFQEQDYDEAIANLEKSQNLLNIFEDKYRKKNNFRLYADIYEAKNQLDSAFFYEKRYSTMKDEIFNEELANNLANVQIAAIEEQSQRKIADQEQTISKNKFFSLFLLSVLVLSIALIVVIFRNYVQTSKINRQLHESKDKIQAQKENLERKNAQLAEAQITIKDQNDVLKNLNVDLDKKVRERTDELKKSNAELAKAVRDLDQFIYKTSHDLRGPIATMQGIINLGVLESKEPASLEYFNTLHKISINMNNVLYRLIDVHETYQKKPVLEYIDPLEEITETTNKVAEFTIEPNISIETDLRANGQWYSDKKLFKLIIESMLLNSILYRDRGESIIRVSTDYKDGHLVIVFEDNGFGIRQGDEDKVFNIFFKGSPRPGGTGLEVYTSKIAVEKLGGVISLKRPAKNTIYEIVLPVIEKKINF
jgi:signal transduction histidine kinase